MNLEVKWVVWSPDGTKIAYTDGLGGFVEWKAVKNDQLEVYVMNPDGSDKRNLTQNKSSDYDRYGRPMGQKSRLCQIDMVALIFT